MSKMFMEETDFLLLPSTYFSSLEFYIVVSQKSFPFSLYLQTFLHDLTSFLDFILSIFSIHLDSAFFALVCCFYIIIKVFSLLLYI